MSSQGTLGVLQAMGTPRWQEHRSTPSAPAHGTRTLLFALPEQGSCLKCGLGLGVACTAQFRATSQLRKQHSPGRAGSIPWFRLLHEIAEALTTPHLPKPLSSLTALTVQTISCQASYLITVEMRLFPFGSFLPAPAHWNSNTWLLFSLL